MEKTRKEQEAAKKAAADAAKKAADKKIAEQKAVLEAYEKEQADKKLAGNKHHQEFEVLMGLDATKKDKQNEEVLEHL